MVVLGTDQHNEVCGFIQQFAGLSMECEVALRDAFPHIDPSTLDAILSKEWQQHIKLSYSRIAAGARRFLQQYDKAAAANELDDQILVRIAIREQFSPIGLCRILLAERHRDLPKPMVAEMLRNPYAVPDTRLGANVLACLQRDNRDGPVADTIRQCIGEEFEVRLKRLATEAGLHYYDENDLRRGGYDKTPDLKLAVPCMYRGKVVNWLESKASFGDADSHRRYMREQLNSYANRFGPGVVIYWFGYVDQIAEWRENANVVTIADGFPGAGELELLQV